MVNKRLSSISCNRDVFNEAIPTYQAALNKSGYSHKLNFQQTEQQPKKRQRRRQVVYYNPPYNAASTVNIGREFLKLIDKHFPKEKKRKDELEKCINRQTVKISYSGTKSVGGIISSHNAKLLAKHRKSQEGKNEQVRCNCKAGVESCPLEGKCLTESIVYKATVTADDGEVKTYTGCTEPPFKRRLYKHRSDTSNPKYSTCTKLAGYYWKKNREGVATKPGAYKWEIMKKCYPYQPGGRKCDLCLTEKLAIMKDRDPRSLNKRQELMNSCRHRWKHRLCNVKPVQQ